MNGQYGICKCSKFKKRVCFHVVYSWTVEEMRDRKRHTVEPGALELSAESCLGAAQNHWLRAQEVDRSGRVKVIT